MPSSMHLKVLSVRLPESEVRRFKSLAASRGVSVQEAVHQALDSWASTMPQPLLDPLDKLQGSLGGVDVGVDVMDTMRQEKDAERNKDERWL